MNTLRRKLLAIVGVLTVSGALVINSAGVAQAHHPIVSGKCERVRGGNQVITWIVQNSETVSGSNRTMTIDQVTLNNGTPGFTIGQAFAPQPMAGSSQSASNSYGPLAEGNVTLNIQVDFSNRGPQNIPGSATVKLGEGPCAIVTTTTLPEVTTTTLPKVTTTTVPEVTTTTVPQVTTTTVPQVTATTLPQVTTTTVPQVTSVNELPKTGSSGALAGLGAGMLLLGAGLRKFIRNN